MNSNFTLRRLMPVLVGMLVFFAVSRTEAQCTLDPAPLYDPIPTFNLTLDAVFPGEAVLNGNVISPFFISSCAVGGFLSNVHFYTQSAGGTYLGQDVTYDCADVGTTMNIWVAVRNFSNDPSSESQRRQIRFTIIDSALPTVSCPANQVVAANSLTCTTNVAGITPLSGDNCSVPKITWTKSGATVAASPLTGINFASGTSFNLGVTTVTYTVSDPSNNTATCSFTVTVNDQTPPLITCPANVVANTSLNGTGNCATTIATQTPTYSDNCTAPSLSWTVSGVTTAMGVGSLSGVSFNKGVSTIAFQATDNVMQTATCSFTVTVSDNELPVITSVPTSNSIGTSTGGVTPMDLCDGERMYTHPAVNDNCPGPYTLARAITGSTVVASGLVPPGASETRLFNLGLSTVTYTVTDAMGNTSSASFTVTVVDNVAPVITPTPAPFVTTQNVTAGDCSKVITFSRPSIGMVADCGVVTFTETVLPSSPDPNVLSGAPAFNPMTGGGSVTVQFPVGVTIIRYTWTDNVANTTFVDYTFIVRENEAPTALCKPVVVTVSLDANTGMATVDPLDIDNGSTDNCGIATLTVAPSTFDCDELAFNQSVTLTVTDKAGNTATCTATVDIIDVTPPVILCPANQSVAAGPGCVAVIPALGMTLVNRAADVVPGTFFDNSFMCPGLFTVTYSLSGAETKPFGPIAGLGMETFVAGTTTVTIRVTGPAGIPTTCSFNVTVSDLTGPTYTGGQLAGSTIAVNANTGGCLAQATWIDPTFTDPCSGPVTVTKSHAPGSFFFFGTTLVTYTASDAVGNITTHTFTVQVIDNQPPVANCKNISVNLNGTGNVTVPASQIDNNSTDNCFFNYTTPSFSFNCANLGLNPVTLVITDGQGNSASCQSVITVVDNQAPVAVCASLPVINLSSAGNFPLNAASLNGGSTDNCPASLQYAVSVDGSPFATSFAFNCSHLGNRTITLRVTDGGGNTATCSQVTLVKDITAPTFTVPASVVVDCDDSILPANTGQPTNVTDACDATPTVTFTDQISGGGCPQEKTITRFWMATDDSGNTLTLTQVITVIDDTAPVFSMESIILLDTDSPISCVVAYTAAVSADSVSDNCASFNSFMVTYTVDYPASSGIPDVIVATPGTVVPQSFFPIGSTFVRWTVTDPCGNSSTFVQRIIVNDTQPPVFQSGYEAECGKAYVLQNTTGSCSNTFTWVRPVNLLNHVFDCSTPFTVFETISDPSVQNALNATNPYTYTPTFSFQTFPTAQFPVGITTVTYTATDAVGNSSVCSFTVEVKDVQPPALTCPPNQIFSATCPTAQIPDYRNLVQISDNCPGSVDLTQTPAQGTTLQTLFGPAPAAGQQFSVFMTGMDDYNTSTCSFSVTLADGQAPIPTLAVLPDLIDSCGGFIIAAPTAIDPCNPNATIIYGTPSAPVGMFIPGTPPRYNLLPGNYVITWIYNDGNGNISSQVQKITVLNDIFPPVAQCRATYTVNLTAAGNFGLTAAELDLGSFDPNACGPITLSVTPSNFTCANLGSNVVSFKVTDNKGNMATCTSVVTVKDVTAPFFASPANFTIEACTTIPPVATINPIDACDFTPNIVFNQVSTQTANGFGKYNYTITRTWTVTDDSGNTSTGTQVITVQDTEDPVFASNTPNTIVVYTDFDRLTCDDTVSLNILPFISDCATGADLTVTNNLNPSLGANITAVYGVGAYTVTFTAKDATNNTSTHTVVFEVVDGTPPIAACINGVSVALQPSGTVIVTTQQINANSFDNCAINPGDLELLINRLDDTTSTPGLLVSFDCSDADGVTQHPVGLTVTDPAGNVSNCETYIIVQDNVNPNFTFCPANKTIDCDDDTSIAANGQATATDNCPANVTLVSADVITADTTGNACTLLTRTWTATDLANNTQTCVQVISIQDNVNPTFNVLPANDTINCNDALVNPPVVGASDNCSQNVLVTLQVDTTNMSAGVCGNYSYTVKRTWTAEDACGNTSVHTQTIVIIDTLAPTFPGLPDTLAVYSVDFPSNLTCTVPVSFNVGPFVVDCSALDEMLVLNDAPMGNDSLLVNGHYLVGDYLIQFTATDACGNVGKDSMLLQVVDNNTPTLICNNNIVIALGTNGEATLTPDDVDLGSTDNCGIDTMYLSQTIFDCSDLGLNPVTLTAIDVNGNSNFCTVEVDVTVGNSNIGFTLTTADGAESSFSAGDGTVSVTTTGGTGTFTYQWSNGATTSTVNNLGAGIYTVTVTDTQSGCVQIGEAEVLEGAKLKFTVGNITGGQNEIVQVPVTVDNFNNVEAFKFSMHIVDANVGLLLGVDGPTVNPALTGLFANQNGNDIGVLWTTGSTGVTLPNGSIAFNLNILLTAAPFGSTSPVTIDGVPVALEFLIDSMGTTIDVPANLMNGSVTIDSTVDEIDIAGDIRTWRAPTQAVPNATVNLTGGITSSQLTGVPGTYLFTVPGGTNTNAGVTKSTPGNSGLSSADLLLIVNHIFGATLPSPYQWVAADVNADGNISLNDYLRIQRVILGTDQNILGSPDWKFVPKSYVFPAPNPLSVPFPQNILHTPADMDFLDDDFVAVRMGDVNGSIVPSFNNDDSDDRYDGNGTFRFRLDDRSLEAGDVVDVAFRASDFNNRLAYQFTLGFDANALELADIQYGDALPKLSSDNFGVAHLDKGLLTTLWVSREALSVADHDVLFTLRFRALNSVHRLSTVLHAGSEITRAEAYDASGNISPIELQFVQPNGGIAEGVFALHQNQPNPFNEVTNIGFQLPESCRATLRVFNASGQLVRTVVGNFEKGYNNVELRKSEFGASGIYWYELETPTHSARKKMVLID